MILLVEDESGITDLVYNLKVIGYEMKWVSNIYDAVYYITKKPGHETFNAIILDWSMSPDGLPDEAMQTARETYAGIAFYRHVLNISPRLQSRTIMLTGYAGMKKTILDKYDIQDVTIIDKIDENYQDKIIKKLRGWGIYPKKI